MTMVVGAQFEDGIVILSDSRATLVDPKSQKEISHHDAAQKLFPLTKHIVIGFAGSFASFVKAAAAIRRRISKKEKLQHITVLGPKLQNILKEEFKKIRGANAAESAVEIVIAGYSKNQTPISNIWVYRSSNHFKPTEISGSFCVIGSGTLVSSFIKEHWEEIKKLPDLKSRADWLIHNLESQLDKKEVSNIGGLFQVLLIKKDAVYPLHYGSFLTDPYAPGDAHEMKIDKGIWTQINRSTGETKSLLTPNLIPCDPKSAKFRDFTIQEHSRKFTPHIHYLISSARYELQPGTIDFTPVYNMLAANVFPYEIPLLLNLGFRVPHGKHLIEIFLSDNDSPNGEKIAEKEWQSEAPILDQDVGIQLNFTARKPCVYFFEVYINSILIGRRPILITAIDPHLIKEGLGPKSAEFFSRQETYMSHIQDQMVDVKLQQGVKAFAAYFFPCRSSEVDKLKLRFDGIVHAFYPKHFPKNASTNVCFGFRAKPGMHRLRLDLVNATTRNRVIINETKVSCSSYLKDCRVEGELVMPFQEPGVFVLEQYVDDSLCADAILLADNYLDPFFYSLTSDAIKMIKQDGGLYLCRNSVQSDEA
jgi:20S proteasome alpha/beta subunit